MRRDRLLWSLIPSYLAVTVLAVLAVAIYLSQSIESFYLDQVASDLSSRARLLAPYFIEAMKSDNPELAEAKCREWADNAGARITVILASGRVIGDSDEDYRIMDNHADRSEIAAALAGRPDSAVRFSQTLQQRTVYAAIPVLDNGSILGAVRASRPLTAVHHALAQMYVKIIAAGLVVCVAAALISIFMARRIIRPLEELRRGARQFAEGRLEHKLAIPQSYEFAALAETMNQMASQLDERIRTIIQQHNEQEAILSSMIEGVLAVNNDERIITINQTAADILSLNPDHVQNRSIQELVRNPDLQRFVRQSLVSKKPLEADIVLHNNEDRFLQVHGSVLRDAQGHSIGALLVMNDITRLRRLENIRRDFVANVSHEIKTPITSIKGFVETLRDGAIDSPEDAKRFLDIILKHVNRLNAIIDDLLSLSRLEQEAEEAKVAMQRGRVRDLIETAVQECAPAAAVKSIKLEWTCPENIVGSFNALLLEQAVVNLLDNAIKYSRFQSTVYISVNQNEAETIIAVKDHGCGIANEHLARVFERFYRVDKARSSKMGGTGLGLAIVKHVAQAHGGYVDVESAPGEGSTFYIHLPRFIRQPGS